MKLRYLLVLAGCGLVTLSTASAASLTVASQDLTPVRTCILSAYSTGTETVEADGMVEQANPTTTYGTKNHLYVASGNGTNMRAYISFALASCIPAIPSTATVTDAVLRLYAYTIASTCRTYDVFRVGVGGTTYWPNSLTWSPTTLDWTNQPAGGGTSINNPPAGDATGTAAVGTGTGCTGAVGYASWGVTVDVQAFVNGTDTNDGWMIRDATEGSPATAHTYYRSERDNTATQEPQLVISYLDVQ
jgi:hypothetical protein